MRRKQKNPESSLHSAAESGVNRRKWAKRRPPQEPGPLFDGVSNGASVIGKSQSAALDTEPPAGGAAARREHRPAAAAGGPLFQYYGHCCDKNKSVPTSTPPTPPPLAPQGLPDEFPAPEGRIYSPEDVGEVVGQGYRIRPCNCRRWFCRWCGPRLGVKLRYRLKSRLEAYTGIYGVTLTVDGTLFPGPEQAWLYVMENRLLSRLVRELARRGHLHTSAYFWVVEFQRETEQPHWHLLLDAKFVPYGELVEIWSRFRPETATPLAEPITAENYQGKAPAFGSVRFSESKNAGRAGYYATKYLTKYPREGYPAWVLDRCGRMPRFGHSHRFFPRVPNHDPMCFCDECCGEIEPAAKPRPPRKKTQKIDRDGVDSPTPEATPTRNEAKTIRERVALCGQSCTIVQVNLVRLDNGTIVDGRGKYEGKLEIPFEEVCRYTGLPLANGWQLEVDGPTVSEVEDLIRERNALREAS